MGFWSSFAKRNFLGVKALQFCRFSMQYENLGFLGQRKKEGDICVMYCKGDNWIQYDERVKHLFSDSV